MCMHTYIYTHVNIYLYMYMYKYINTYIYICIFTYIYIYIYKGKMDKGKTVVNSAEPVPGAVCSTRRSRISDKQRAPRAAHRPGRGGGPKKRPKNDLHWGVGSSYGTNKVGPRPRQLLPSGSFFLGFFFGDRSLRTGPPPSPRVEFHSGSSYYCVNYT